MLYDFRVFPGCFDVTVRQYTAHIHDDGPETITHEIGKCLGVCAGDRWPFMSPLCKSPANEHPAHGQIFFMDAAALGARCVPAEVTP